MALYAVLLCKTKQNIVYPAWGQFWHEKELSPSRNWLYVTWNMRLIVNGHVCMSYLLMGNEALQLVRAPDKCDSSLVCVIVFHVKNVSCG